MKVAGIGYVGSHLKGRHSRSNLFIMHLAPASLAFPWKSIWRNKAPAFLVRTAAPMRFLSFCERVGNALSVGGVIGYLESPVL